MAHATGEDAYARTTREASALSSAGDHRRAAARLAAIAHQYPQDLALQLQIGWLHFQAADHASAERAYRRALRISPTSWEARLGLAWALLREQRQAEARALFRAVLAQVPDNQSAQQGLVLAREPPRLRFDPAAGATFFSYQDHPTRSWGLALNLSLPLVVRDRLLLGVAYRYQYYADSTTQGSGGGRRGSRDGFSQHEVYVGAGWVRPRYGVVGQYARVEDTGSQQFDAHVAGLSARYSPWGDLLLAGNVSFYQDLTVARVAPAWQLPIRPWLRLTPGVAVQVATANNAPLNAQIDGTTETLVSGSLSMALIGAVGRVWIGGKLGDEVRRADLDLALVHNIAERVQFGGWAGGSLRLGHGWTLLLSYALERLESRAGGLASAGNLHLVALGLAWSSNPRR